MNFEDFKRMVERTRCARRFNHEVKINNDELVELVDTARITSSAKNMQPLKYIIVNDEEYFNEVHKPIQWAAHLSNWDQSENERPSAYIIVVNDTSIEGFSMIDAGIAMQTIMLGLNAKGYAGCMLASIDKQAYKKLFSLKDHLEPMMAIAVGICDEEIGLVEARNGDINYYRENDKHIVPKRPLDEVLLGCY